MFAQIVLLCTRILLIRPVSGMCAIYETVSRLLKAFTAHYDFFVQNTRSGRVLLGKILTLETAVNLLPTSSAHQ